MLPRRGLAVLLALVLAPLGFATLLFLPHDSTTREDYVPETRLTAHVVSHVYWACLAAGLAVYLYSTRRPRPLPQAWREDAGACIAFVGLVLLAAGQFVESLGAATLGHSTDDRWHDLGIIAFVGPAEALLLLGLLVFGVQALIRRRRNAKTVPG